MHQCTFEWNTMYHYLQKTRWHNFLHHDSAHPKSLKDGIPFSQAFLIKRICSKTSEVIRNFKDLKDAFTGLNKLHAWWRACRVTNLACNMHIKRFSRTQNYAHKSTKTLLSSTIMLFMVVSYFCVWNQIISVKITALI